MLFSTLLCIALPTVAQPLSNTQKEAIITYLDGLTADNEPGFVVGVIRNGAPAFTYSTGLASLQHEAPVTLASVFNVASVAKQFTALVTLQAIQEGKLNLDDDIRMFYPDFYPDIKEPILIRHLLTHTSGIRDYCDLMSLQFNAWWRRVGYENEDAIAFLSKQQDLNFTPGSDNMYSNSNYTLLTGIVSKAVGEPFPAYAKKLFQSLGMNNTFYQENYMAVIKDLAFPYADWGDGVWQEYPMLTSLYGDGFLYTTLEDQVAFEAAVQQAGPDQKLLTVSQKAIPGAERQDYGYGLELHDRNGFPAVHHSGSTGAYHAETVRYPDQNLTVVVMSNNSTLWSGYINNAVSRILLPEPPVKASTSIQDIPTPGSELTTADITGKYQKPGGPVIRIEIIDDELYWKNANNNPQKLIRTEDGLYHREYDPESKLLFCQDKAGSFTVYSEQGKGATYDKLPAFSPTPAYLKSLTGTYRSEELDVQFTLRLDEDNQLVFDFPGRRPRPIEVIYKDDLLYGDFQLRVYRDDRKVADHIKITYNQVVDVVFSRI